MSATAETDATPRSFATRVAAGVSRVLIRVALAVASWLANSGRAMAVEVMLAVQNWRRWRGRHQRDAIALDCGSLAISDRHGFADPELKALTTQGEKILAEVKEGKAECERLREAIEQLDPKLESPKIRELKSQIKSRKRRVNEDTGRPHMANRRSG